MKLFKLPFVIGHRGACGYAPENTLASIHKAHVLGLTWVEVDVMLTRDEALVIIHDETLERTTNGCGNVRDATLAYIKSLDAGSWFGAAFTGEQVPTLREVLTCCQQLNLSINIELKACAGEEKLLAEKVLAEVALSWSEDKALLLSSFSMETLVALRELQCKWSLGWNLDRWQPAWKTVAHAMNFYSLHYPASDLNASRVAQIHAAGYGVLAYTINTLSQAQALAAMGVNAIFSDVGDQVREAHENPT